MFDKRYQVDRTFFTVKKFPNPVEAASRIDTFVIIKNSTGPNDGNETVGGSLHVGRLAAPIK